MSDTPLSTTGASATLDPVTTAVATASSVLPTRKGLDLAVLKKGAKDYLDFLDSTKEVFYAYLYHRTGSETLARTFLLEIYLDVLSRAMSLWWYGTLSLKLLLDTAEKVLKDKDIASADLDTLYLPSLVWFTPEEKKSVATLHDALWSLPKAGQQILILSLLIGLSDERIAQVMRVSTDVFRDQFRTAKDFLLSRWQPTVDVLGKIQSLVFVPSLDLQAETKLRFSVVEKYNALRYRRYQWVIVGGLFAVMSNVIVAGVLAFAVIVQPAVSLQGTRTQVATLDAVLLQREQAVTRAKSIVADEMKEARGVASYTASNELSSLGLSAARNALQDQQKALKSTSDLQKILEKARTAFVPILRLAVRWFLFI
jgi:DNA-directed RNA polymerase specialized sigma24 family protein